MRHLDISLCLLFGGRVSQLSPDLTITWVSLASQLALEASFSTFHILGLWVGYQLLRLVSSSLGCSCPTPTLPSQYLLIATNETVNSVIYAKASQRRSKQITAEPSSAS